MGADRPRVAVRKVELHVPVEIVPEKPRGYEFTCGINMYRGKLIAR